MNTRFAVRIFQGSMIALIGLLLASCGAGNNSRAPILGIGDDTATAAPAPWVTTELPTNNATGVPFVDPVITATFSEPVQPIVGPATFTLSCEAPCVSPTGTVSLNPAGTLATYTLSPIGTELEPSTLYTATVAGAASVAYNTPMAEPFTWTFTTEAAPVPQVTAETPVNGATGVPTNSTVVTAAFSEAVEPIVGPATFTLTCEAPCTSPAGTVTLNPAGTVATFTLSPIGTVLQPSTIYTATVDGATSVAYGVPMAAPYVWSFTTGLTPDLTRPRVTTTLPLTTTPGPTFDVPTNTAITATFTEDMDPLTIDETSFTLACDLPCIAPVGLVSYAVGSRTAVLTPGSLLEEGATYTATVTVAATDLAGNQLGGNQAPLPAASNYVWTFSTAAPLPPMDISVLSTDPIDIGTVCPTDSINATFTVPSGLRMDPLSLTSITFSITGPALAVVQGSVTLDPATGTIATFNPLNDLTSGETYIARIRSGIAGVKDLAVPANAMLNDVIWTFSVDPPGGACLQPVALNGAQPFGVFGGSAGMTNTGIQTIINGDIGTISTTNSSVTGFHDVNADIYTETPANVGVVNGVIYTCTTSTTGPTSAAVNPVACDIATNSRLAAEAAFIELAGLAGGPDPGAGNLANLTLAPGVYTATSGSFMIEGGDLTLDPQGDADAVWVFQMATSLTVGGPGAAAPQSVILIPPAQSKNVFWQVGSAATINAAGGGTMEGTIIAQDGVSFSTVGNVDILTLNGRALSLGASVTLVDTVINVPAP